MSLIETQGQACAKQPTLQEQVASLQSTLSTTVGAIDALLDELSRPVGARQGFTLNQSPAADRAIIRLFDLVGRNP